MPAAELTLVLTAAAVILLVLTVFLLLRSRRENDQSDVADAVMTMSRELEREMQEQNRLSRAEQQRAIESLTQQTGAVVRESYALRQDISDRLSEMQQQNARRSAEQTDALRQALDRMQIANEQKLEQMRLTVDEKLQATLTDRLDTSFKNVSEQLSNVYRSLGELQELSGGVTALNRVLSGVKTRGVWAEAQLESLLEQTVPGMYVKNFHAGGGSEMVEFAVKVPADVGSGEVYLPIDSKFPTEDYLRLCDAEDAGDEAAVKAAKDALEKSVVAQAKNISKYIVPPMTTPFAVMYLATDALYATVLSGNGGLADRIHTRYRVLAAGPSTMTALLSTFALGFRTAALNRKAGEVMTLLADARQQYERFGDALAKTKRKLEEAGKSLEDAEKRNEIIVKKLRGVEAPAIAAETPADPAGSFADSADPSDDPAKVSASFAKTPAPPGAAGAPEAGTDTFQTENANSE
ncbi:MAG: DNA recombination protein RmuC [Clostridia bacterium]|nr:DNA recombination protein RmuC [Clostridia bacterium]